MFIEIRQYDATVFVRKDDISSVLFHEQPSQTQLQVITNNGVTVVNVTANQNSEPERFNQLMSDFEDLRTYLSL